MAFMEQQLHNQYIALQDLTLREQAETIRPVDGLHLQCQSWLAEHP
jgi:hypothetical protein